MFENLFSLNMPFTGSGLTGAGLYDITSNITPTGSVAGSIANSTTQVGPTLDAAKLMDTGMANAVYAPSSLENTMKGLGYGGMALSGLGNLYGAYKGIDMMEEQQKLAERAYNEDERRRRELEQLNF